MHANRAKEIADRFDKTTDRTVRLDKAKAAVFDIISRIAAKGGYYCLYDGVDNSVDDDILEPLCQYLRVDCGYRVDSTQDEYGSYIEIFWD